jgi:predicted lipoprotein
MDPTDGATSPWVRRRPRLITAGLLVLLAAAIAGTTKVVDADSASANGKASFNAADYAAQKYDAEVVPAIEHNAVAISTLLGEIVKDPKAAGEKYGHHDGITSPYAYAASGSGVAGQVNGTLLPVDVAGLPDGVKLVVQIGPAINGTALRDATGLITFDKFLNQIEYANASSELNNQVKKKVLSNVDAAALTGKKIRFVGAFTYGSNTKLIQITPVRLEAGS